MFCRSAREILTGDRGQLPYAAVTGAMQGAVAGGINGFLSINREYKASKIKIHSLQTDLNILRNKIKENYPRLDNLNETMGDLNVV